MKTKTVLSVIYVVMLTAFSACSSFPQPEKETDSLLVVLSDKAGETGKLISMGTAHIITFTGPLTVSFDLRNNEERALIRKVTAGEYAVSFDQEVQNPSLPKTITVEAGTVTFFQYHFLYDGITVYARHVSNIERKKTLALLSDYIGFGDWYDFRLVGYGNLKPKMFLGNRSHILEITGEPDTAGITIDGTSWGTLPFKQEFSEAKYTVEIEKRGYQPVRKLIDLKKDISLSIKLKPLVAGTAPVIIKDFRIVVFPFQSRSNDGENPYGNMFPGSFSVTFRNNRRLEMVELSGGIAGAASIEPDFKIAEERGADLVITGEYYFEGNNLYIHPVLWDAKSERIKYSNTYISPAGFSIFNSIDNMAEEFSREVSRVLPEAGEAIVEKEDIVTEGMSKYEKQLFVDNVLSERAAGSSYFLVSVGFGGTLDRVWYENEGGIDTAQKGDGPGFMGRIGYAYMFTKEIGWAVNILATFNEIRFQDFTKITSDKQLFYELYLFTGVQYVFGTPVMDLCFTVGPSIGMMSSVDYYLTLNHSIPLLVYAGLNMEVAYRYYFQDRVSQKPFYISTGIMLDIVEFQFNGIIGIQYIPIQFNLFIGGGLVW